MRCEWASICIGVGSGCWHEGELDSRTDLAEKEMG